MRIGKITENALKRSIIKLIKTESNKKTSAAVGADCAFSESENSFSATATVTAKVSKCGYYAVMKAANSLIAQGIKPDHVVVNILLDKDSEEAVLKKIVRDAISACNINDIAYAGGHTEVTEAVTRPIVTATCVGTEVMIKNLYKSKPKAGDALVVSKWIGMEGTAMLAAEKRAELATKYPEPFIDDAEELSKLLGINSEAAVAMKSSVSAIHDVSGGGIYAALWEMGERAGTGLKVDLKCIPVRQETIEVCEFFEINPYVLASGGALLFATEDGEALVRDLEEAGIPAAIVGYLEKGRDKIITNLDETRFLEMPQADEIHKVLG